MIIINKSGLYFHIPFCKSKCPYCDFYSEKYNEKAAEEYKDRVVEEIKKYHGTFDTIYFGGGTPSIMPAQFIGDIIKASKHQFDIDENSEITIECNPSKDLSEDFKLYKSYGINRISIGMQSAVDSERFALGRSAGQKQVEKAVLDARNAGIDNISLDVMLGTPKQSLASLDETFDFIEKMHVNHISAYMLKIEQNTKFFEIKDKLSLPDEDETADMYLKTIRCLNDLGLKQYEISNFSKKGYESRHNIKYWKLIPYLGIGKSAHSFRNGERFYYDRDFNLINDGIGGSREEAVMLGLRLNEGVNKDLIKNDFTSFIKMGFIEDKGEKIALTPKGMLVSNIIINELI